MPVEENFSSSRKASVAILGAIVVIVVVLLLAAMTRFIRSRLQTSQNKTPQTINTITPYASPTTSPASPKTVATSRQPTTYKTMPETGPNDGAMLVILSLLLLGSITVVVSQKIS